MSLPISYLLARAREVFVDGDATTVRILLAMGSLGWTIGLWLPLHTFDRQPYSWMASVGSERWWGVAFLLHFVGVLWRTFDPVSRIYWGFAVNLYGVLLWMFMAGCITFAVGGYTPGSSLEWCLIVAGWVSLIRTGTNEGKGTP